ncbi:hypothetical protein OK016_22090 [Vibrio chagasii]|nr:hypothetical protein [Vibrio chagasii]
MPVEDGQLELGFWFNSESKRHGDEFAGIKTSKYQCLTRITKSLVPAHTSSTGY